MFLKLYAVEFQKCMFKLLNPLRKDHGKRNLKLKRITNYKKLKKKQKKKRTVLLLLQ